MKENEVVNHVACMEEKKNLYKIFGEKIWKKEITWKKHT
jgi:hypothetical protein